MNMKRKKMKESISFLIGILFICSVLFSLSLSVSAETDSKTFLNYGTALELIAGNSQAKNVMDTIRSYQYWAIFQRTTTIPDREYALTYVQAIASSEPLIMTNTDTLVCGAEVPHVFCYFAFSWNPYGPYWSFSNMNHRNMTPDSSTRWKNIGSSETYVTPSYTGTYSTFEPCPGSEYALQEKQGNIIYYPTLNDLYNETNGETWPPYNYFTGDYWNYTLENVPNPDTTSNVVGNGLGFEIDTNNYENGKIAIGGENGNNVLDISFFTSLKDLFEDTSTLPDDVTITIPQSLGGDTLTVLDASEIKSACDDAPMFRTMVRALMYLSIIYLAWILIASFFGAKEVTGD